MRFNDMIGTVMAQPQTDPVSRLIVWRQLVDILAQSGPIHDPDGRAEAIAWLNGMRTEIAPTVRASVAHSIAPRLKAPDLVAYFAQDDPAVAAPVMREARLDADQWRSIIAAMPTASRALLRERRDLPEGVEHALTSFGSADYALAAPATGTTSGKTAAEPDYGGQTPIADIVARIEAFRAQRALQHEGEPAAQDYAPSADRTTAFDYETDVAGDICYVSCTERAALCGMSIAAAGDGWLCGVDGHAAGAFRAHTAFSSARLRVAGIGPAAGDWVIDGEPIFDGPTGKFLGYRGSARRPMHHERAEGQVGDAATGDSIRQLVHELRTPLNAIQGFAEMIERELLGPVAAPYRARARTIMSEGARLLSAIEDIDIAARLANQTYDRDPADTTDAAALLTLVARELRPLSDQRRVHLRITRSGNASPVRVASSALHRLFTRLLSAMLSVAQAGETLDATLSLHGDQMRFAISRPSALTGRASRELLDPSYAPDGDWPDAPLLGLAFGLRLISNLAEAVNVNFRIKDDYFSLILPATQDTAPQHNRTPHSHGDERLSSRPPQADERPA